jgi:hypothetical protein
MTAIRLDISPSMIPKACPTSRRPICSSTLQLIYSPTPLLTYPATPNKANYRRFGPKNADPRPKQTQTNPICPPGSYPPSHKARATGHGSAHRPGLSSSAPNKPNFRDPHMDLNPCSVKDYRKTGRTARAQNKPNWRSHPERSAAQSNGPTQFPAAPLFTLDPIWRTIAPALPPVSRPAGPQRITQKPTWQRSR